jgi:predicted small integral membrane protein
MAIVFFLLALLKYPVRKLFLKTKLYTFFRKAHRPFAVVAWLCITAHAVIAIAYIGISLIGIAIFIAFNVIILLGFVKTYINKKMPLSLFRFHKIFAAITLILIILHHIEMGAF